MTLALRKPGLALTFFLLVQIGLCQIPKQGSVLHYTEVYFETNFVAGASRYELRVYGDSLHTNLIGKKESMLPAFWVKDLKWGHPYWWTVNAQAEKGTLSSSEIYQKFTLQNKINALYVADTKMDVKCDKSDKNAGGLIVLDHARGIFDREGKQIWALPTIKGLIDPRKLIRDLNVTFDHHITVLAGPQPVELDFEGHVLWRAPYPLIMGGDTIIYHHDFKKYENGHYFVLGNKKVSRKVTGAYPDSVLKIEANMYYKNDTLVKRTVHGMLLEFDENGKLVWFWESNSYIRDEDLNYKKSENGTPTFGTHMNAFSVNAKNTKAYLGFRDLNRIVRVDKKSGKVDLSYGEKYPSGEARIGNDLFRGQHDATITNRHTLLVFNNNNTQREGSGVSSILELKENASKNEDLLVWKFDLNFDTLTNGKSTSAGNISELANGNLLVCGGVLPRIFEVNKSKEIVWDAFMFSKGGSDSAFTYFPQYRSHWTSQLYFYHLLATCDVQNNSTKNRIELICDVYNTGNCEDTYLVELIRNEKEIIQSHKTQALKSWEHVREQFQIKGTEADLKTYHLKIQSMNDPHLTKELTLN
ncbi:MAG: aryl-sulfate sulfotransferase [bacterium]|nr:aryl-sulfate sulfotransferase [bacterium]